jgi:hypothetical protein
MSHVSGKSFYATTRKLTKYELKAEGNGTDKDLKNQMGEETKGCPDGSKPRCYLDSHCL